MRRKKAADLCIFDAAKIEFVYVVFFLFLALVSPIADVKNHHQTDSNHFNWFKNCWKLAYNMHNTQRREERVSWTHKEKKVDDEKWRKKEVCETEQGKLIHWVVQKRREKKQRKREAKCAWLLSHFSYACFSSFSNCSLFIYTEHWHCVCSLFFLFSRLFIQFALHVFCTGASWFSFPPRLEHKIYISSLNMNICCVCVQQQRRQQQQQKLPT